MQWPVSWEMEKAGFTDCFREIHPDLDYASETISAERLSYRIDDINIKGKSLEVMASDMYRLHKGVWPSDHPAVSARIKLK